MRRFLLPRSMALLGLLVVAGCPQREASPPPSPPPPAAPQVVALPPPPAPPVVDAGALDAADAGQPVPAAGKGGGHHHAASHEEGVGHGGIGKLTVGGNVARADVEHALGAAMPKLKACAKGKGQVEVALTIGERGWPTLVDEKRTTLPGADSEACIVATLRALRFPKPSDGKDVSITFVLQFR